MAESESGRAWTRSAMPSVAKRRRRLPSLEQMLSDDPALVALVLDWDVPMALDPHPDEPCAAAPLELCCVEPPNSAVPAALPAELARGGWRCSCSQCAGCCSSAPSTSTHGEPACKDANCPEAGLLRTPPHEVEQHAWAARQATPCALPPIPGVTITTGHEWRPNSRTLWGKKRAVLV